MNRSRALGAAPDHSECTWCSVVPLVVACGLLAFCCALIVFGTVWTPVLGADVVGFVSFVMFVSAAAFVVLPIWFLLGNGRVF